MTKSEAYHISKHRVPLNIKKECITCGLEFQLYSKFDIKRKKFCSISCKAKHYNPRIHPIKYCQDCNKKLQYTNLSNYCRKCKSKYFKEEVSCAECNKKFLRKKSRLKYIKTHFCNDNCMRKYYAKISNETKKEMICTNCNKIFKGYVSQKRGSNIFCSCECCGIYYGIRKNPSYKHGRTSLRKSIRNINKYNNWQHSVYRKDKYLCTKCHSSKRLNAHHIKPFEMLLNEFLEKNSHLDLVQDKQELLILSYSHDPFWDINNGQTLCEDCHLLEHNKKRIHKGNCGLSEAISLKIG